MPALLAKTPKGSWGRERTGLLLLHRAERTLPPSLVWVLLNLQSFSWELIPKISLNIKIKSISDRNHLFDNEMAPLIENDNHKQNALKMTSQLVLMMHTCYRKCQNYFYTLFHEKCSTFFSNNISFPERRNKRKSVLEITKMYYFKI